LAGHTKMAQTGYTPISIYYSATSTNVPTAGNLVAGELAINTADGKLFYKDSAGVVQVIAGKGGAGVAGGSNTQVQYNSSGSLAGSANMTFSGTALTLANDASISGLTVGKGGSSSAVATAVGVDALKVNQSTGRNSGFGYLALTANTSGANNTGLGDTALYSNTTGANNVAVGMSSLLSNTTASNNTAVGYQAGYTNNASTITAFGYQSLYSNSSGIDNASFGDRALYTNSTGTNNIAMGTVAMQYNTTGANNTALGTQALRLNTTASNNTAVGYQAGYTLTSGATNNAFFGYQAGYSTITSGSNQFFGYEAGKNVTTGYYNTVLGAYNGNQGGLDIRTANNYIVLADGQGNPRGTFDASGNFLVGKFAPTSATVGCEMRPNGIMTCTRSSGPPLSVNRTTDDGDLVSFQQDGTQEGSISVSGTTVSYNGGHLSRWSQWQNQTGKPEVYRGSVLESTNDMCEWNQANEQATKTIVSTTAKSKAVAGVFDMYDLTDETNPYDFYVAQSGDFVIRIAQGVAVENGDLLESAGDGTARPQSDDICRSSTVAKVTSNYVSITYADGSYCVPCILMIG